MGDPTLGLREGTARRGASIVNYYNMHSSACTLIVCKCEHDFKQVAPIQGGSRIVRIGGAGCVFVSAGVSWIR